MKTFWVTFFGSVIGVIVGSVLTLVLGIVLLGAVIGAAMQSSEASQNRLPTGDMVLELDLRIARLDQPSASPFAFAEPLSTVEIVAALQRAESDDRVKGLFIRANEFGIAPGQAEELRAAFSAFQDAGKFVIAHAQGFEGVGITSYFAVGNADEIWLQDTASFSAVGLASETLFFGGLIDQYGAQAQFEQFHEYKNAANVYTQSDYTDAHREAALGLLNSVFDSAITALAADRGIDAEALREIIVSGPYSAEQAEQAGLVDRLGHVATAREVIQTQRTANRVQHVLIEDYIRNQPPSVGSGAIIALIEGQGPINTGLGDPGLGGAQAIGGDAMANAIDAAAANNSVRAILIRIDSPGGSAIASDQVWDAIMRARDAGKPVVASMGSLAASGGYYIAAPADLVFAHGTTITGSIGVLGGKVVVDGALQRVGLNLEPLAVGGEYALAFSPATEWTEAQRTAFSRLMEDVYEDFTLRVAEGRDLPLSRVQEIARGRVWTGAQALELGLVDQIGGLRDAVDAARELAGLEEGQAYQLRRFPRRPTPLEAFQALFGLSADGMQAAAQLSALLHSPQVRAALEAQHQARQPGVQTYAPVNAPQ
ncbi:MAG: signal peptide peptidase SppA [Pseudomonadota bacterium]